MRDLSSTEKIRLESPQSEYGSSAIGPEISGSEIYKLGPRELEENGCSPSTECFEMVLYSCNGK